LTDILVDREAFLCIGEEKMPRKIMELSCAFIPLSRQALVEKLTPR